MLRKHTFDLNQFYWMSRHFVWLIPLTNLLIFLSLGMGSGSWLCGRRGRWLGARLLCAFTLLAPLWAAFPRIYGPAALFLALGIAARLVPILDAMPPLSAAASRSAFPSWRPSPRSWPPRSGSEIGSRSGPRRHGRCRRPALPTSC